MIINFDETAHKYFVNGAEYPSVTTLLKDYGLIETRFFNDAATDRGTRVHQALEAIDSGVPASLYDSLDFFGYVQAWLAFRESREPEFYGIEKRFASDQYRVAGTVDRLATIEGRRVILDIKTGAPQPWHGLQLAAYCLLMGQAPKFYGDNLPLIRFGVYLSNDGKYKVKEYSDYSDFNDVRALFTTHNLRRRFGVVA